MRVSPRSLALAVSIALCFPVRRAAAEVEYYESYDKALEAAKAKQQLILILLVLPADHPQGGQFCTRLRETVFSKDPSAAYIARYFAPLLLDLAKVQKREQAVPPVLSLQGQIPIPSAYVFDTAGKRVEQIQGIPNDYLGKLKSIVEKAGIGTPPKSARETTRAFERGKAAFDSQDYPTAMQELGAVIEANLPGDELDAARRMVEKIDDLASESYDKGVDVDEDRQLGSAIRQYRECIHLFPGTEGAEKAARRLKELREDKELRQRLDSYMAAKLLRAAEEGMARRQYGAASESVDSLLKRYPASEHAAAAKAIRTKLDSSPEMVRVIREQQAGPEAQRLLRVAESYTRNQMADKALETYQQIAREFPDTRFAETARKHIRELGGTP